MCYYSQCRHPCLEPAVVAARRMLPVVLLSFGVPFVTRLVEEASKLAVILAPCPAMMVWNVVPVHCLVRYVPFYHVAFHTSIWTPRALKNSRVLIFRTRPRISFLTRSNMQETEVLTCNKIKCAHSNGTKKCNDPCSPSIEHCTGLCDRRGACILPCEAPCFRLPCNERFFFTLSCGHQCPVIPGETCLDGYCQICVAQ